MCWVQLTNTSRVLVSAVITAEGAALTWSECMAPIADRGSTDPIIAGRPACLEVRMALGNGIGSEDIGEAGS